jgi:hypothetical protein
MAFLACKPLILKLKIIAILQNKTANKMTLNDNK